eukprot:TRINITY_DN80091_c0_g1_i1.p2 TRINITY_DN80091_c0_g1~~TRINITY_DN80091_c0_g1_i1.p2  ORF type:complete len:340 (+),score=90.17 TRINITY_DN80091_c0_g1_i1:95-1114(+)
MKCYPIIRGCGLAKALCGMMLIGVAFWMRSTSGELDCAAMQTSCPKAFEGMLASTTGNTEAAVAVSESAEAAAYCNCLSSCVNYFSVYESNKASPETTNCFTYSSSAGIPAFAGNVPSQTSANSTMAIVSSDSGAGVSPIPGTDPNTCASCGDLEDSFDRLLDGLAGAAISAGIVLIITAGCEQMEMKWHDRCYAMAIPCFDMCVSGTLITALVLAIIGLVTATAACEPDKIMLAIEDGGADSTSNSPDGSAAFATFFLEVSLPVIEGLCELKNPFTLYLGSILVGIFCAMTSFFAVCCVCMQWSDDGMHGTPDDHKAMEMQGLMSQNGQYGHASPGFS